jgi:hypothetical protein
VGAFGQYEIVISSAVDEEKNISLFSVLKGWLCNKFHSIAPPNTDAIGINYKNIINSIGYGVLIPEVMISSYWHGS